MPTFTTLALALMLAGEAPTMRSLHLDPTDGTADSATIAVTGVPQSGTTITLWFRTAHADAPLFALADANLLSEDRKIHVQQGRLRVAVTTAGKGVPDVLVSPGERSYADGQWHHVAHTLGVGGSRLYVDGVLVAQSLASVSAFAAAQRVVLGGGTAVTPALLHGELDDVRLHAAVLTPAEIQASMGVAVARTTANLFGYWPLDGSVVDAGPHGWTGTLRGGAAFTGAGAPFKYTCKGLEGSTENVGCVDSTGI